MSVFVNRVQKNLKGNLPCRGKLFTNLGIQNDVRHYPMLTTPNTISFQKREDVFFENFQYKNKKFSYRKKTTFINDRKTAFWLAVFR